MTNKRYISVLVRWSGTSLQGCKLASFGGPVGLKLAVAGLKQAYARSQTSLGVGGGGKVDICPVVCKCVGLRPSSGGVSHKRKSSLKPT